MQLLSLLLRLTSPRGVLRQVKGSYFLACCVGLSTLAAHAQQPSTLLIFDLLKEWKYDQTQNLDTINWTAVAYDDSTWSSGAGLLYSETNELVHPRTTELTLGRNTYYFRTHFEMPSKPEGLALVEMERDVRDRIDEPYVAGDEASGLDRETLDEVRDLEERGLHATVSSRKN